jgi:hypothetical protein
MKVTIPIDEALADTFLPGTRPDGSGIGANYADQYLRAFKQTLPDGRKVGARRRGLKITLTVGERSGDGLLRRLVEGPDVKRMLCAALREAAGADISIVFEPGAVHLEIGPAGD